MEPGNAMACEDCRDAISARLDGEDLPGESERIDAHLTRCAVCAAFAERAAQVTRLTRMRAVEPGPDLAAAVLAAAHVPVRRRSDAVRVALGAVGVGQFALAVSGVLAGAGHHGGVELAGASAAHFSHESSAWNLALAVGFLWAAAGAPRLSGLVPVVGVFVGVLATLSLLDALGGRVDPGRLATHGLVVVGFLLLLALQRTTRDGGGDARTGPAPLERSGSGGSWAPQWAARSRGGDGDLAPTARRRVA